MNTATQPRLDAWRLEEVAEYDMPLQFVPATVLDIGANVGVFSFSASLRWPGAKVIAYEPVPENADRCLALMSGYDRFEFHLAAVRDFAGPAEIWLGDRDVTHSFHSLGRQTANRLMVNCADARFIESCEFVKIDTEGCEVEIVTVLNLSGTKALVCEYHRAGDAEKIREIMAGKGFELCEGKAKAADGGCLKFARPGDGRRTLQSAKEVPVGVCGDVSQSRKIYLALTGHYSSQDSLFVQSLCALLVNPPCRIAVGWNHDPSVERSRNVLAANFLESDCTHMLTIDSDIGFSPADVARIISHDELVVGGMYPLKRETANVEWCGNGLLGRTSVEREDGLLEVRYLGTGFLCIAREVLERMIEKHGAEITYQADAPTPRAGGPVHRTEYAFFRQGVRATDDTRIRFLTEDWMFCQTWLDMGGKVYADSRVILKHAGRAVWPLALQGGNPFQETEANLTSNTK